MQVYEFEQKVWDIDHLRLVIRAARSEVVDDFHWVNAADENQTLVGYRNTRVVPKIGNREFSFVNGQGREPGGGILVKNLRASY